MVDVRISPSTDILYSLALLAETVKFTTPVPSPFGIVVDEPTTTLLITKLVGVVTTGSEEPELLPPQLKKRNEKMEIMSKNL